MGSNQVGVKLLNGRKIFGFSRMAQETGEEIKTLFDMKMVRARHEENGTGWPAATGGVFGSFPPTVRGVFSSLCGYRYDS